MSYTLFYLHFSLIILVFYGFLAYICIRFVPLQKCEDDVYFVQS